MEENSVVAERVGFELAVRSFGAWGLRADPE